MSEFEKLGGQAEALEFAREEAKKALQIYSVETLRTMSLAHYLIDIHPLLKVLGDSSETQGVELSDDLAGYIVGGAGVSPVLYDLAIEICAQNVWNGYPLPPAMRAFASLTIRGGEPKPDIKAGRKSGEGFVIKMMLRQLVLGLLETYDLKLKGNLSGTILGASEIARLVAEENGYHISPSTIAGWCNGKNSKDFREQADEVAKLVDYAFLRQIGVVKQVPFYRETRNSRIATQD